MPSPRTPRSRLRPLGPTPRRRRHRGRIVLALVIAAVVAIPATVAGAVVGHPTKITRPQAVDALQFDDEVPVTVKLGCRGHVEVGAGSVGCHWRSTDDRAVASWQLWNLKVRPEVGVRNLVAELRADAQGFRDTDVEVPAAYVYAVLALDADGEVIGRSRVVEAVLLERDQRIELLHLDCAGQRSETDRAELDATVADLAVWVTCEWRPATSDAAAGYVVWRSVDGGDRTAIARTGLDQTGVRDDDVTPGHRYRYIVQSVDTDGNVVGQSRSVMIALRPHDRSIDDETDGRAAVRPAPDLDVRPAPERDERSAPEHDGRPAPETDERPVRDVDARPERDSVRDR